jgi:hypothetical protein
MGLVVTANAILTCSFGAAPAPLKVVPAGVTAGGQPLATVMDFAPIENVGPFGMCQSLANPEVAAATAAKLGVFTPMPCVPVTVAPFAPGAVTVTAGGMPVLVEGSICECAWGGVVSIATTSQFTVTAS